jgi:peptide/nickel transport system permease protein
MRRAHPAVLILSLVAVLMVTASAIPDLACAQRKILNIGYNDPPLLLLALIIVTAFGGSLLNETLALGIGLIPNFIWVARSLALSLKTNEHVTAGVAADGGSLYIMSRYLFPNMVSMLVVVASLYIATAIHYEASLSFLGLGVPPPASSSS